MHANMPRPVEVHASRLRTTGKAVHCKHQGFIYDDGRGAWEMLPALQVFEPEVKKEGKTKAQPSQFHRGEGFITPKPRRIEPARILRG